MGCKACLTDFHCPMTDRPATSQAGRYGKIGRRKTRLVCSTSIVSRTNVPSIADSEGDDDRTNMPASLAWCAGCHSSCPHLDTTISNPSIPRTHPNPHSPPLPACQARVVVEQGCRLPKQGLTSKSGLAFGDAGKLMFTLFCMFLKLWLGRSLWCEQVLPLLLH